MDIYKRNLSLKKYDAPSVVFNNSKDISIPFTMECTDTLLFDDQEWAGSKYPAPAFPSVEEATVSETLTNPFEFSNSKKP